MPRRGSIKNIKKLSKVKGHGKKSLIKKALKVLFILVIIIAVLAGAAYLYINKIMGKIKGEDISDLDLEKNIYEKIATNLTKKEFDKVINIVVLGVDERETLDNGNSSRSDTIIIVSLNPTTKSIKLVSIPRDTYVTIPGQGNTKINHAYSYGKEALSVKTINSNFGLAITEYITINFDQVMYIVNALNGVEVKIDEQERQFINLWSKESYSISKAKYTTIKSAGMVTLTGEQALAHMRNRDSLRGDFDRAERQREVMTEIVNKISKMNLVQIIKITDTLFKGVSTNVKLNNYFSYIPSFLKDKDIYLQNIISEQVPKPEYAASQMIDGVYYYVPDKVKMKEDIHNILYNK